MFVRKLVYISKRFCSIRIPPVGNADNGLKEAKNLVPRSLTEPLTVAINGQINQEYCASYMYRSMSYHFASSTVCLLGLSEFYRKLAIEENEHAELLADVLLLRDAPVTLETIAKPPERHWSGNIEETLCETLALEMKLSHSLSQVYRVAETQRDVVMMDFITTRFLRQQCESMRTLQQVVSKWNQLRRVPDGLYLFDREIRNWTDFTHPPGNITRD